MENQNKKRVANVRIPTHVPREFEGIWKACAQRLAEKGSLVKKVRKANNKPAAVVDYQKINQDYSRVLSHCLKAARAASVEAVKNGIRIEK